MTLVVVGASLAGLRAVESARRVGYDGRIVLIGAEEQLPYDRPPLSKAFLDPDGPASVEPFRSETELREDLGVELMLGAPADGLDTEVREVSVSGTMVRYEALVLATGATARRFPGSDGCAGVHTLRTAQDAAAVRAGLDRGARTVVIGAGFIGSEVASAARKRGLPVTVVETLDLPLVRSVGRQVGSVCADLHRAAGTDLRLSTQVMRLEAADGVVTGVRLSTGEVLPADLVVAGTGVYPATRWLEGSGVPLHERDRGVVCDATLSTGLSGVYAAGDVAHVVNPLFDDESMRLEHWTNAAEQGAAAARHALDPAAARPLAAVPYFWSDWYGHRIQFVGTSRAEEVVVAVPAEAGFTALYRRGDRIVGALTVDRPREIMKYRRRIAARGSWAEAVAFAATTGAVA
ncbi:Reductase C-terminal [Amycolatopsis marina]|uniref:Pyridine nucleotide-disulfide oxidoreductase n=3 Tax=Pseudonocardiaceae TaxID=2070 RepID=A0A2V4ACL3_9PSEU|nr:MULTISPECIES: FAD-dependent oxidoreductase [Pseudonocardiaceae]MBE1579559.1 NADPH-dependent 2,4-dienoyl-CoA reductase/sulfur reductase-like enzyme [Amycolatopsis roodepoortensis]OLZ51823.1 FAD-dependent oxidoreductase [Amycolatopsis keratiniphila subsp. nogabecina]PXY16955.1 pyridine nucleotide-disulfide oxidoreductase [Prauserella muralis]TWE15014.1 NAD/ferredoxin-dependent reductase-like protein [Prauserella muralis]SDU62690.1 Reductase C-terminal [Amycolatopsis keratiniphila]